MSFWADKRRSCRSSPDGKLATRTMKTTAGIARRPVDPLYYRPRSGFGGINTGTDLTPLYSIRTRHPLQFAVRVDCLRSQRAPRPRNTQLLATTPPAITTTMLYRIGQRPQLAADPAR